MHSRQSIVRIFFSLVLPLLSCSPLLCAQSHPASPAPAAATPSLNDKDVAETQSELIRLLRLSPTLTTVVSHDPSLLSNQDYVARNNPQLAAFLTQHPEVARNPDYFLFSHLKHANGQPDEALERVVWPDIYRMRNGPDRLSQFANEIEQLIGLSMFFLVIVWLTRMFIENRRWGRIFKLQSEVHSRLIDKFSSSQELVAYYMESEAGRRFLEGAPIPLYVDRGRHVPNAVARVLTPLQIGVVLVLLGSGLMLLRHAGPDYGTPMLVLGTIVLMPGIGFILSAGITWVLAARLGLLPPQPPAPSHNIDSPHGSTKDTL